MIILAWSHTVNQRLSGLCWFVDVELDVLRLRGACFSTSSERNHCNQGCIIIIIIIFGENCTMHNRSKLISG